MKQFDWLTLRKHLKATRAYTMCFNHRLTLKVKST